MVIFARGREGDVLKARKGVREMVEGRERRRRKDIFWEI